MKIYEYNEMMAYLTRPAVNRVGFKPGGLSQRYTHRYNQAISTPELRENIKKFYGHKLPKNVKFNFKKYPGVGVPYYGDTHKLANQIRGVISHPGSSVRLGMDAEEFAYLKKKEELVNIIEEEAQRFEKNEKFFPKEKYPLHQEKLKALYEAKHGKGIDTRSIKKITDEVYKNSNRVKEISKGGSIATQLSKKEIDFFNKNYTKKSLSQMTAELSGGRFHESKEFKSLRAALMRRRDSLIKEGVLTEADFEEARGARKLTPEQRKVLQKGGFKKYREAQKRLMDLDPESYGKYKSPSTLDSHLKSLLQYGTVRGATSTLPNDFLASFEHFQGITPASITQDPSALSKVGIVAKKYNWKLMGGQGKYSPYHTVRTYLRTAREELKQNDIKAAKKSLDKVNTVYDEVTENLKTVNRQELPKNKIEGSNIVEKNVAGVIKPQTLQKSFDQYFRNIAGYATEKDLARIKKTQPNVAKALKLYKQGNIKEAKNLIGSRISEVRQGHLFSKTVPGLETLINTVKSMPNDFKAKRYWTLGLKGLGIAATPLIVHDGYTAIKEGLPPDEVVAKALLGADKLLYKGKEYLTMSPEARAAKGRKTSQTMAEAAKEDPRVKGYAEMYGFEGKFKTDFIKEGDEELIEAAEKKYADYREKKDAARAFERAGIAKWYKDRIFGLPLKEITDQVYNQGGRVKDKDEE